MANAIQIDLLTFESVVLHRKKGNIRLANFSTHTRSICANNRIRRQQNEKFTYHRHNAWVGYRYRSLLQYDEQFAQKSKTCLCKQNRRHYYVNKKSSSFILYNTNRVLNISINTRFVLLYIRFCRFNAYIGNIAHDTYF